MTQTASAAVEFTPASMKPRHLRGKSEARVFNQQTRRWERRDQEGYYTLRKVVFGSVQSTFDLRNDMQEALAKARLVLGV